MSENDDISRRIRALLAKTREAGCTEQEAMAAAELAGRLLDKYGLSLDSVQTKANLRLTMQLVRRPDGKDLGLLACVAPSVAAYTDCRAWRAREEADTIFFLGPEPDALVAFYLMKLCAAALASGERDFRRRQTGKVTAAQAYQYQAGMAARLCDRLAELKRARNANSDGRALVISKSSAVEAAVAKMGMSFAPSKSVAVKRTTAFEQGFRDGDKVALNPGVTGPVGQAAPAALR